MVAGMATASGLAKVGSKSLLMGGDYDATSSDAAFDFVAGSVTGATALLGLLK